MRIAFVNSGQSGVDYWRMWNPAEALKARGHEVVYFKKKPEFEPSEWFDYIFPADVVVIPWNLCKDTSGIKNIVSLFHALRNGKWNPKVFVDIDDHVKEIPDGFVNKKAVEKFMPLFEHVWKHSDGFLCATEVLAKYYSKFNKTYYCPNAVNPDDFVERPNANPRLRIGWAGGGQHSYDIGPVLAALKQILSEYKDVEIATCGLKFDINDIRYSTFDHVPFEHWFSHLAFMDFDIGIAYQEDNVFNSGKSNLKYLENAMMGTAGIYSKTESYSCVKNGKTGLVAKTFRDFVPHLRTLIESPTYRQRLIKDARKDVIENWNIKEKVLNWENAFNDSFKNNDTRLFKEVPKEELIQALNSTHLVENDG